MFELGGGAGLALEALHEFGVEGQGERQHLDGHFAVQRLFPGPEDDGHAAPAQLLEDLVFGAEGVRDQRRPR